MTEIVDQANKKSGTVLYNLYHPDGCFLLFVNQTKDTVFEGTFDFEFDNL